MNEWLTHQRDPEDWLFNTARMCARAWSSPRPGRQSGHTRLEPFPTRVGKPGQGGGV